MTSNRAVNYALDSHSDYRLYLNADYTILRLCEDACIKRDECKVDDPGQDGTQSIDGGFAGELFEGICHECRVCLTKIRNIR